MTGALHLLGEAAHQMETQAARLRTFIAQTQRDDPPQPHVEFAPYMRFGEAHIAGIPVDSIVELVAAGEDVEATAGDYGLSREQVIVACWFVATHGTRKWKKVWGPWATDYMNAMWSNEFTEVPDPPAFGRSS